MSDFKTAVYRHDSISRFRIVANVPMVGGGTNPVPCEFNDYVLVIRDPELNDAFLAAIQDQPKRIQDAITLIDEEAAAKARRPVSNVTRGQAQSRNDIPDAAKGGGKAAQTESKSESSAEASTKSESEKK